MADWIANIPTTGLPWWAGFVLLLFYAVVREIPPVFFRWWDKRQEKAAYEDSEVKKAREALVEELKKQVQKLDGDVKDLTKALAESNTAHAKCQIEQEHLRGDLRVHAERMNTMQVQLDHLLKHDQANADNTKKLAQIVKEETGKAPTIV